MPEFSPLVRAPDASDFSPSAIALGKAIGGLPDVFRQAQADQRALQFANIFQGGFPTLPDGTPDYQTIQRMIARFDPKAAINLSPEVQQQQFNRQIMGGDGGAPSGPPPGADQTGVGAQVAQYAATYGPQYGTPPDLIQRVAWAESRYQPGAVSPKGAGGVMQFMPETARDYGVNPRNVESSVRGGAQYLGDLLRRYNGNEGLAVAAYNWGESRVDNWLRNGANPRLMPTETLNYVRAVTAQPITAWTTQRGGTAVAELPSGAARTVPDAGRAPSLQFAGPPVSAAAAGPTTTGPGLTERALQQYAAGRAPSAYIESEFSALPPSAGQVTPRAAPTASERSATFSSDAQRAWPTAPPETAPWPTAPRADQAPAMPLVPRMTPREIQYRRLAAIAPNHQQSQYYLDLANQERAQHTPIAVRAGETLIDPGSGRVIATPGVSVGETGATLEADATNYRLTGRLPPNMGRGIQGNQQATTIRQRAVEQEINEGGNPADWPNRWQQFHAQGVGMSAGERTRATREENLKLILRAADAAIPAALEQSEKVGRTGWVPLNRIVQAGQVAASDPALRAFGMANLQLAEHWARAMNPQGVMRESDRDKALAFLSTADSPSTYRRLVRQLQTQIHRELTAVQGGTPEPGDGGATSAMPGVETARPGQNWITLPSGVKYRRTGE
jgi:hypothetical protein